MTCSFEDCIEVLTCIVHLWINNDKGEKSESENDELKGLNSA